MYAMKQTQRGITVSVTYSCGTQTRTQTQTINNCNDTTAITFISGCYDYNNSVTDEYKQEQLISRQRQQSYSAFHNAIYGSKFRQAKHSSKQIHCALKQNNRRTRNNGMIKNRIRNYNKPATL